MGNETRLTKATGSNTRFSASSGTENTAIGVCALMGYEAHNIKWLSTVHHKCPNCGAPVTDRAACNFCRTIFQ